MKITRDKAREKQVFAALAKQAKFEDRAREGYHVSDLLHPLKTYWTKIAKDVPPTNEELLFWYAGRAHHSILEIALVSTDSEESIIDPDTGIIATPDMLALQGEFKTTRWNKVPVSSAEIDRLAGMYAGQCKGYAIAAKKSEWWLYVLFLCPFDKKTGRRKPDIRVYKMDFTQRELSATKRWMKIKKERLDKALKSKNPSELGLCPQWMCYIDRDEEKIPTCRFWDKCKPRGRYG